MPVLAFLAIVLVSLCLPASTAAQTAAPGKITAAFASGLVAGHGDVGASLGATIAADLTSRVSLEGRGIYLGRGRGADALDLHASLLVDLTPPRRATPYLVAGAGLYRAHFDLDTQANLLLRDRGGMMAGPIPGGATFGGMFGTPGAGPGGMFGAGRMPAFYADRVSGIRMGQDGRWGMHGFTDPSVSLGGGLRFDLTDHLVVRPDVRALVIVGGGMTHTVTTATVGIGYRF
ncbi:MAG: hypothetical protein AB1635_13035 [Acidobacteriota bacterium]